VAGFRAGDDIDADPGSGRRAVDSFAGVSLVDPDVADGRCDPFCLTQQSRERGAVLHVGRGDDRGNEDAAGVNQDVALDAVYLFAPSNPRGPVTGDAFTDDESTTAAVSHRRRPERVRASPRTAVSILAQIPVRHQRRKWRHL
jgi:hypothetical protein